MPLGERKVIDNADKPTEVSGPFYYHDLTLIPAWISNYIHHNV